MHTQVPATADTAPGARLHVLTGLAARDRWIEIARIVVTWVVALLLWRGLVPI